MKEACKTLSMTVPITVIHALRGLHDPSKETWSKFLARLVMRGMVYEIARVALETKAAKAPPPTSTPIGDDDLELLDAITEPVPHVLK